ncbi:MULTISPECIES: TAT-variant-translocated molybdopterin oxidoreductase [unclassified Polaribacter]|uniref:TAT-variant-translocated molybdopterin oxidoreductase n=1 Tax=unclassified Polaribacter TaxID=196858 RepID=UPI0011BD6D11|nr:MULTISPECIES: TAT-variant-translocated molybdopterin oxidoreductase [unclassified Polaribacter]TXD53405.1 4Fe-4S dicluster domain-containing protein [Polaribacter sp. IC063]TXD61493.1 4Fe-4S dicluster domain-containing protein [Polaribacter sp. IC066]
MASNKKYWKSVEELKGSSIVETMNKNEFVEAISTDQFLGDKETLENSSTSRRDFLKYVGFTTAAASLAACEGPVRKSIPYVVQPNDVIAGVPDWYATSMADGYDFANVLVKTREGRPIQIMPNKEANGTTSARVQASVLSLYDEKLRIKEPTKNKEVIGWNQAEDEIKNSLTDFKDTNKSVVLLTGTMASPSTAKIVEDFIAVYPNAKHVIYDAVSESAAADAMLAMHGKRTLPNYHLNNAKTIVSFGADFLGDFHGGLEKGYINGRKPATGHMSYHVQFESNMSLTGANSDKRVVVKPSDQVFALLNLYNAVTGENVLSKATPVDAIVKKMAFELKKAGSKGVVLTGLNDKNAQLIALSINKAIGSEIIDTVNTLNIRQGNDTAVAQLVSDMKAGTIAGLVSYNVNPIYSLANSSDFSEGLKKVTLKVALSTENNETVDAMDYALPTPHFLESWGDTQFDQITYGLMQPTIQPLFNTRQAQDILLNLSGSSVNYYDYLKGFAAENILNGASWNKALHNGFFKRDVVEEVAQENVEMAPVSMNAVASALMGSVKSSGFELNLYTKIGLGDGKQANNPWLQEFPDPITRTSWDNYLTMSMADAKELGFENPVQDNGAINGDYAKLSINGKEVVVPVMVQPGQAKGSVGLALGFGRTFGLKEEMQVGVNAYALYMNANNIQYGVKVEKVDGTHRFACTQVQKTIAGRHDILKVASLKEYNTVAPKDHDNGWNKPSYVSYDHKEVEANTIDLWDEHNREMGHHFNLSIDLTSCTGCGACVVACHAENNVPVVGKDEVRVGRDMHWLRIDRYYSSEVETREDAKELGLGIAATYEGLETEAENPEVTFQPMMCQHCNHAPCETVCPVAATTHGRQGQNQMTYNRCVGTRYCANNCPYRVRRFNWFRYADNNEFDFNMNNQYGKMVLNPDVVVRSRGVMEKCSMCIQLTQATILKAKKEGRAVNTDEFETACSSACTTGALVFGDINNKEDQVTALVEDKRAYNVLDYLQTKPNVIYQVKIRNTNEA